MQYFHISKNKSFIISENVDALKDVWMVGDVFLCDAMKELSTMTQAVRAKNKPAPYLYQMYNISGYFASFGTKGPLNMINPLIDALNDNDHLPKLIITVPDKDIITITKYFNSQYVMGKIIHYIVKQFDLFIKRRYQDLLDKHIGSVLLKYPKTIWIRMLKRPSVDNLKLLNNAFNLRGKFNAVLEERLLDGDAENHHIMSIVVQDEYFYNTGELSDNGKAQFWNEVSKAISKFDIGKITLNLRNHQNNAASTNKFVQEIKTSNQDLEKWKKLPTPPKTKRNHSRSATPHRLTHRDHKRRCRSHSKERSSRTYRSRLRFKTRHHRMRSTSHSQKPRRSRSCSRTHQGTDRHHLMKTIHCSQLKIGITQYKLLLQHSLCSLNSYNRIVFTIPFQF